MNLSNFDPILDDYVAAVNPTATQDKTINSALQNLLSLMLTAFPDAEGYAQGSYATDTLVKPLTAKQSSNGKAGEYDIDIVIERTNWDGAVDALDEVASLLEDDPTYGKMPIDKDKNSCVRIEYAQDESGVSFHVDLVPTKLDNGIRKVADRDADDWKPSDAKEFADKFNELAEQQPELRSLAIILKRLRDRNELTDDLKSIVILTLVMQQYSSQGSLMGDLVAVIEEIASIFGTSGAAPVIDNPVNEGEDLGQGIKNLSAVRKFFTGLNEDLTTALSEDDADALKEIFGPGFKYETTNKNSLAPSFAAATAVRPAPSYGGYDAGH